MWSPKIFVMCAGECFFFLRSHLVEKMGQLNKIEYLDNGNSTNCLQPFIFFLSIFIKIFILVVSLSTHDPYCFPRLTVLWVEGITF